MANFFVTYTWAVQLIRGVFHLDITFICWLRVIRIFCCVFWSLHGWRSWWHRRQGVRRYHKGWWTELFKAFLIMSLWSTYFIDEVFFWWKANLLVLNYSLQVPDYQDFQIIGHQIVGILLNIAKHKICMFYCQVPENASYLALNCVHHTTITMTVHVMSVNEKKYS